MRVQVAAAAEKIAIVVPVRVLIEVEVPRAEPFRRLLAPDLEPVGHHALVGAPEEPEIVDVESRRLERQDRFEPRALAADLPDVDSAGVPRQRRRGPVEARGQRIRALEVVEAVLLDAVDRRGVSVNAAAGPVAGQAVPRPEAPVEVDAAGDRALGQERQIRRDPAVGRCHDEPHERLVGEFAPNARNRVARDRLDRHLGDRRRRRALVQNGGVLAPRLRVQRANRERADPSRELAGREDRRLRGRIGEETVAARQVARALRRPPDPARIEHLAVVEREVEGARSLDEERAALIEKRLERGQVHDRWVGLDLSEVGVHRARQGEARRQPVPEVQTGGAGGRRRFQQRIAPGRLSGELRQRVGHHLESFGRRQHRQAGQLAERRHEPGGRPRQERPARGFLQAADLADHGKPEPRARDGREAQLRERNVELGGPSGGIARHAHRPDGVPAAVAARIVEPVAILLHARRVDGEFVRGAAIVVRVDEYAEPVARRIVVAARQKGDDSVRLGVVRADLHVQRRRVERHAKLGALARRGALARLALDECGDRAGGAPDRIGQRTAGRRGRDALRDDDARRRLPGRRPAGPQRRPDQNRHDDETASRTARRGRAGHAGR